MKAGWLEFFKTLQDANITNLSPLWAGLKELQDSLLSFFKESTSTPSQKYVIRSLASKLCSAGKLGTPDFILQQAMLSQYVSLKPHQFLTEEVPMRILYAFIFNYLYLNVSKLSQTLELAGEEENRRRELSNAMDSFYGALCEVAQNMSRIRVMEEIAAIYKSTDSVVNMSIPCHPHGWQARKDHEVFRGTFRGDTSNATDQLLSHDPSIQAQSSDEVKRQVGEVLLKALETVLLAHVQGEKKVFLVWIEKTTEEPEQVEEGVGDNGPEIPADGWLAQLVNMIMGEVPNTEFVDGAATLSMVFDETDQKLLSPPWVYPLAKGAHRLAPFKILSVSKDEGVVHVEFQFVPFYSCALNQSSAVVKIPFSVHQSKTTGETAVLLTSKTGGGIWTKEEHVLKDFASSHVPKTWDGLKAGVQGLLLCSAKELLPIDPGLLPMELLKDPSTLTSVKVRVLQKSKAANLGTNQLYHVAIEVGTGASPQETTVQALAQLYKENFLLLEDEQTQRPEITVKLMDSDKDVKTQDAASSGTLTIFLDNGGSVTIPGGSDIGLYNALWKRVRGLLGLGDAGPPQRFEPPLFGPAVDRKAGVNQGMISERHGGVGGMSGSLTAGSLKTVLTIVRDFVKSSYEMIDIGAGSGIVLLCSLAFGASLATGVEVKDDGLQHVLDACLPLLRSLSLSLSFSFS
ncbi:hypothetical protein CEUSTIGMA_g13618.t1 [Chlamydomonas eustigma]|uniref:Uncharacterized protein n=1 Tax=Chlamydomonas eustigma TaxID=1157962 RepID=A0A250XT09_9CHLO|nr:hypothetical protein CEUSTIGMA_g13618.t1 [Chlamydomonas eustigma]|eukprot:GAX86204.1 hypothetical protein CEUSTIGMA_g13618.t1 [Chlamydomonas eustigma]